MDDDGTGTGVGGGRVKVIIVATTEIRTNIMMRNRNVVAADVINIVSRPSRFVQCPWNERYADPTSGLHAIRSATIASNNC